MLFMIATLCLLVIGCCIVIQMFTKKRWWRRTWFWNNVSDFFGMMIGWILIFFN